MSKNCRHVVLGFLCAGLAAMASAAVMWSIDGGLSQQAQQPARQESSGGMVSNAVNPAESGGALMEAMRRMQENPNDADALLDAARILSEQGKKEAALSLARRASVSSPSDPRPPHIAGVILAQQEKWEDAVHELERSIALKDDASARYSAAVIYRYHLMQEEKAKPHFSMAAKLCSDPALATIIQAELGK
ncbi:MAG: hypothetical protein J6I40_08095 [Mailhella sp.]|nr:hypothetical protein [Mailhella sp.]